MRRLLLVFALVPACAPLPASIQGPPRGAGPGSRLAESESFEPDEPRGAPLGVKARTIREPELEPGPLPYFEDTGTPKPTLAPTVTGEACLGELASSGVSFVELGTLRGVATPVEIRGPIGRVTFFTVAGTSLRMDCRLALALVRLAPLLESHGVTHARYSGAYVYKTAPSGRLSHHAHGLAIDLHGFTIRGREIDVERDFVRGAGCRPDGPVMNTLACELRESRMFEEFLTPDYNYDHRDHLHVSVPRLDGAVKRSAAR